MSQPSIFDNDKLQAIKHPTPFFLFSKKQLTAQYKDFRKHFAGATVHYAIKANSEPEVISHLKRLGSSFEVASKYEFDLLKAQKVPSSRVIYGTSVKPLSHIKTMFSKGVDRFAADSTQELEKIAAAAPGSKIYIRLLVNDSGSVFRFSEKFGTEPVNLVPLLQQAKALGLVPYGVSFHVGSQASDPAAWSKAIELIRPELLKLEATGIRIQALDIGGGYPCAYSNTANAIDLDDIAGHVYKEYTKLPYQPKILMEPGRGIVATTGVMVASVIGKVERQGMPWLFLDGGVYNGLFEAMAYQGSTRYRITALKAASDSGVRPFAIAGPTGDSPDIITHDAILPANMDLGDRVVIHDAGAYSVAVTSRFNGFPKPKVYFV